MTYRSSDVFFQLRKQRGIQGAKLIVRYRRYLVQVRLSEPVRGPVPKLGRLVLAEGLEQDFYRSVWAQPGDAVESQVPARGVRVRVRLVFE